MGEFQSVNSTIYKADHECDIMGTFTNEKSKYIPDKNLVENLHIQFPELPLWMLNSAVLFHNKNPHYMDTNMKGTKMPTGKEKRKAKREVWAPTPEWFGETPEERIANGDKCRSQEEALEYIQSGHPEKVSSEAVIQPIVDSIQEVEKIVETI